MNPSETDTPSRCEACRCPTDDFYILRDGSIVCVHCSELWEYDRAKQN